MIDLGLVDGTVLYTDSTHLKASANKNRFDKGAIARTRASFWNDLYAAIDADRIAHGKRPLPQRERKPAAKEGMVSRTDPEADYMVRDGKPKGFFYLDHRTVDGWHGIITDNSHATPATVHDAVPYLDRLDRQRARFGFDVQAVGLHAGYANAAIANGLENRDILGGLPQSGTSQARNDAQVAQVAVRLRPWSGRVSLPRRQGADLRHHRPQRLPPLPVRPGDLSGLPASGLLHFERQGAAHHDPPRLAGRSRTDRRPPQDAVGKGDLQTSEGDGGASFTDAKQLFDNRYARFRSLTRVRVQCLLPATAQNIKKIALAVARQPRHGFA